MQGTAAHAIGRVKSEEQILAVRVAFYRRVRLLELPLAVLAHLQPIVLLAGRLLHLNGRLSRHADYPRRRPLIDKFIHLVQL